MGERRELNPRMVDSQSTALIHLATSAPSPTDIPFLHYLNSKTKDSSSNISLLSYFNDSIISIIISKIRI